MWYQDALVDCPFETAALRLRRYLLSTADLRARRPAILQPVAHSSLIGQGRLLFRHTCQLSSSLFLHHALIIGAFRGLSKACGFCVTEHCRLGEQGIEGGIELADMGRRMRPSKLQQH